MLKRFIVACLLFSACSRDNPSPCTGKPEPPPEKGEPARG